MFKNDASEFVYTRTYSRWVPEFNRRETWPETVDRYISFLQQNVGDKVPAKVLNKIKEKILNQEVMPSMRALWAAGTALARDSTTGYNCSALGVDSIESFSETLYILMCGTGVGFSVESKYIEQLPVVSNIILPYDKVIIVEDSKKGWADSVKIQMQELYLGRDVTFDYNAIRPAGARLETMGGRASGPGPLAKLHSFIREIFYNARGRKLKSIECHDIMNEIAEIVVVGGTRRSSQISLSDLNDESMREAKSGIFPVRRYMANNSAVFNTKPDVITFLKEWTALAASGTGERGIFNLFGARLSAPKRRNAEKIALTNPCGEILLRNRQFCNLSEVVVRIEDDIETLLEKVETATWLGVIQSSFTNFPYLRKEWKNNCEEECLLGVSITGQMDNPEILTEQNLKALKNKALRIAKHAADKLGINVSTAVTCVKPSGTVGQLTDASSGLHPRFDKFYIRRYRIAAIDPLYKMLKSQGIKLSPENGQSKQDWETKDKASCPIYDGSTWSEEKVNTWIISFPVKAPETAKVASEITAIEQLEWYKKIQNNWCEHNASITVYVRPEEWIEVGNWVYKNWEAINGVSFLPYSEHKYKQAPYESISEDKYLELIKKQKKIDYSELTKFELEDNTQGAQTLACVGGICEI